jgi:Tol biopolymer transport system component
MTRVGHIAGVAVILAVSSLQLALAASTVAARQPTAHDGLPTWSRQGDLAYSHRRGIGVESIMVLDRTGVARRLLELSANDCCIQDALEYSPDGRTLALVANFRLFLIDVATGRVRLAGPADQFDWAPNSRSLVVVPFYEGGSPLRIVRRSDGRIVRKLRPGDSPRWSPDGRLIAYAAPSTPGSELNDVYMIRAGGGRPRRLLRSGAPVAWSRNSRRLAFSRYIGAPPGTWVVSARGGTPRRIGQAGPAVWSPSGRHVALDTGGRIQIVTSRGLFVRRIAGASPEWSPDGRAVAFSSVAACSYPGIWRADLPRRRSVRLTGSC